MAGNLSIQKTMKTKMFYRILTLLVWTCLASSMQGQGNLLVNGSFEQPAINFEDNVTGSFSFPGWTGFSTGSGVDGNAGIVAGVNYGLAPYDGNQDFSFNGMNPPAGTYIEQTFSTTPGGEYSVAYAIGRNNGFPDQALTLEAQIFGSSGQIALQISSPPATVGWLLESFDFVADSDTSTIQFTDISASNPNTDLNIDAVSVASVVPEPDCRALLLLGLGGAGGLKRFVRSMKSEV
jgi:hypothetical protein